MAFRNSKGVVARYETDEEEAARLARGYEGSDSRRWSKLPVTFTGNPEGRIVRLPAYADGTHVVVLLTDRRPGRIVDTEGEVQEYNDTWDGRVVGGNSPVYTINGHHLSVSRSEIRRGELIVLD